MVDYSYMITARQYILADNCLRWLIDRTESIDSDKNVFIIRIRQWINYAYEVAWDYIIGPATLPVAGRWRTGACWRSGHKHIQAMTHPPPGASNRNEWCPLGPLPNLAVAVYSDSTGPCHVSQLIYFTFSPQYSGHVRGRLMLFQIDLKSYRERNPLYLAIQRKNFYYFYLCWVKWQAEDVSIWICSELTPISRLHSGWRGGITIEIALLGEVNGWMACLLVIS